MGESYRASRGGSGGRAVVQSAKPPEVRSDYPRQPQLAPFQGMVPLLPRALGYRAGAGWSGWTLALPDHLLAEPAARNRGRTGRVHEDAHEVLAGPAGAEALTQEEYGHRRAVVRPGHISGGLARGYASALEGIEPPGAVTALELHLIDVDNRGNACRPTLVRDGVGVSFLRALTTAQDGWREHGHALRLELPVHCPRG